MAEKKKSKKKVAKKKAAKKRGGLMGKAQSAIAKRKAYLDSL